MAWCSQDEIEDILSATGLYNSTNDDQNALAADAVIVANAIERGESRLAQHLASKYDTSTITSANVWVKWAAATFCAIEVMRRKGGVVPPGLQELYEEYVAILNKVESGAGIIPGLSLRSSPGISISNLKIDNGYQHAKIRKVETISYPVSLSKLPTFRDRLDFGNVY